MMAPDNTLRVVLASVIFVLASITDGLDGYLARRRGQITTMGMLLDPLAAYGAGLDERPQIVVLNKIDLSLEPPSFGIEDDRILRVLRISAATGAGVGEVRGALFELVPQEEEASHEPVDDMVDFLVYRPRPRARPFKILKTDRGFRVTGRAPAGHELEEALRMEGPEVTSQQIGLAVLERLRALDEVAYMRFASVYKGFEDRSDFEREAGLLAKATDPKRHH